MFRTSVLCAVLIHFLSFLPLCGMSLYVFGEQV